MHLKLAFRRLFKTPFVTAVAVISLALGIGANAAIFSLFDQTLLRALPVQEPARLVNLSAPSPKPGSQSCGQAGDCDDVFSYPMFKDLERAQTVLTGIAAHVGFGANLSYQGQTRSGSGLLVSGSYFPVLGLQPAIGRLLDYNDDRNIGGHFVAVLSHCVLDDAAGRQPGGAESADRRERTVHDDRGGRAARLQRHDAGSGPRSLRPRDDAAVDGARLEGLRRSQELLGLPLRTSEAWRLDRAGADIAQRRLQTDHQRRRGAASEGHERSDDGEIQGKTARRPGGTTGAELDAPRGPNSAHPSCSRSRGSCC